MGSLCFSPIMFFCWVNARSNKVGATLAREIKSVWMENLLICMAGDIPKKNKLSWNEPLSISPHSTLEKSCLMTSSRYIRTYAYKHLYIIL